MARKSRNVILKYKNENFKKIEAPEEEKKQEFRPGPKQVSIFSSFDTKYLKYLSGLVGSYKCFNSSRIYLYSVNIDNDDIDNPSIKTAYKVYNEFVDFDNDFTKTCYIIDNRFRVFSWFLQYYIPEGDFIYFSDVDSIINKSLSNLIGLMEESSALFIKRRNSKIHRRTFGGIFMVKNDINSRLFFKDLWLKIYDYRLRNGYHKDSIDQLLLYKQIKSFKNSLIEYTDKYKIVSRNKNDKYFIWSPNRSKRGRRFLKEGLKYERYI